MLVTREMLEEANACEEQLALFNELFPDGVEDTIENINYAVLKGLHVRWAINKQLIKPTGCIIDSNGDKFYYQDGRLHRIDGPAIEFSNGNKYYYQDSKLHRIDGPAIELSDGGKYYYQDDLLHRTDGPAIEYSDGYKEWWVNSKRYTRIEFNIRNEMYKIIGYSVVLMMILIIVIAFSSFIGCQKAHMIGQNGSFYQDDFGGTAFCFIDMSQPMQLQQHDLIKCQAVSIYQKMKN